MGKPAISVIVVFHNAETTIERTLNSFVQQSFTDVEYVFVDDGSTDNSVDVIKAFMVNHTRINLQYKLIYNSTCRGSAYVTALGLLHSSGEYVMRCDADDYLVVDALALIWKASENGRFDAVFAPYFSVKGRNISEIKFKSNIYRLNDMSIDTLHFALWNKLIRRDILVKNDIVPFDGIDCWEDLGVVSRFMAMSPSVSFMEVPTYNYVVNQNIATLSRSRKQRLLDDHLAMAKCVEDWFEERGLQYDNAEFLNHLKFCAKVKMLRGRNKDVRLWKQTFPEVNGVILKLRHIPIYFRLMFYAVAVLPTAFTQLMADSCRIFYKAE